MQPPDAQQRGMAEGARLLQQAHEGSFSGTRQQHLSAMCACIQTLMGQTTATGSAARAQMKRELMQACEMLSNQPPEPEAAGRKDAAALPSVDADSQPSQAWVASKKGSVRFEHICGLGSVVQALRECLLLPRQYPVLFVRLRIKPARAMLLYGPPGTGKSMLARAVANEIDAAFFETSCAQLISRWVGESEKLMNTLFASAHKAAPSVLFLDEVDSIASSRDTGKTSSLADQRLTNQLLLEMDAAQQAQGLVFVLAATNLPWQLDPAVLRRFGKRVYVGLPEFNARRQMFVDGLGETCSLDAEEYDDLAQRTEGYSGSDIRHIVSEAVLVPLHRLLHSTSFSVRTKSGESEAAGDPEAGAVLELHNTTLQEVLEQHSEDSVVLPVLRFSEVLRCVEAYPRSVSTELAERYAGYQNLA
jgi:vacuolar protein-sorting-associated protein 4